MSEEINIKDMPTSELYELMKEDLYDGLAEEIGAEVEEALSRGEAPYVILTQGLVAGMDIVGADFRDGNSPPASGRNRGAQGGNHGDRYC